MSSEMGRFLRISVFGESHGPAVGALVDGLPAGEAIDQDELAKFCARRRPGSGPLATTRHESDAPEFVSGFVDGHTTGSPLCVLIRNKDVRSGDYTGFTDTPRPSHADYSAGVRFGGHADMRGGGHFSGRLTAPLCVAGGIAKQILARRGITVGAHLLEVGGIHDEAFEPTELSADALLAPGRKDFPVIDDGRGQCMQKLIETSREEGDSVGGCIQCAAIGLPAGIGSPMFDGVEGRLSYALFAIPAVKGVSFGAGFASASMHGSENNDPFAFSDGNVVCEKNDAGGILGGITTGMPLVFATAFKPTPSIAIPQRTVSLSKGTSETLKIEGRHDPCVALRAVPVCEAVCAAVLLDMMLEEKGYGAF